MFARWAVASLAALGALGFLLVGCDSGEGGVAPAAASCNQAVMFLCKDLYGLAGAELSEKEASCTNAGGEWAASSCPTASRVASCRVNGTFAVSGGDAGAATKVINTAVHYYAGYSGSLTGARTECEAFQGAWTEY